MLSNCCDAPIYGEVTGEGEDAVGLCSRCKEWANAYDEEEDE